MAKIEQDVLIEISFSGDIQLRFSAGTDSAVIEHAMNEAYDRLNITLVESEVFRSQFGLTSDNDLHITDRYEGNNAVEEGLEPLTENTLVQRRHIRIGDERY